MSKNTILYVEKLVKEYNNRNVVNNLSFYVNEGEIIGLLGPNGAGKTTAFYMTMGLIRPDSGNIFFKDINVTSYPIHKRAEMGMGYLAQEPSCISQPYRRRKYPLYFRKSFFGQKNSKASFRGIFARITSRTPCKKKSRDIIWRRKTPSRDYKSDGN